MQKLVQALLDAGAGEAELQLEVEKLVRAYDPCLSCSVH
jgi:coenzyme F420-reducing hydrogenase alpha subunit